MCVLVFFSGSEEQQHEMKKKSISTAVDTKICSYKAPKYNPHTVEVAGSTPDEATDFSGRTMTLASNQPRTEMSTRGTSWGVKAAGARGW